MRARVPTSLRRASGAASRSTHTQTQQQHPITHTWGEVARNRKYGASIPVHEARSGREVCCVFKKEPVFIIHLVLTAQCKLPYACCLALASCRRPSPPSIRGAPVDTWPYRRYYRRVSANSGGLKQYQGSRAGIWHVPSFSGPGAVSDGSKSCSST